MEPEAYDELHLLESDHWWYRGMRHITERLLSGAVGCRTDLDILDAGCGTGGNLTALARFGHVRGFDYSPLALTYAGERHRGKLARASVEALPFSSDSFDLVTSFDVIVCYEVEDDLHALREFARVARPGGHVLVRVAALPALRGPHDIVVHGVRRYAARELRVKLEQVGLRVCRLTYANSMLMPLIFVTRKLQNLSVGLGSQPASDVSRTPPLLNAALTHLLNAEAWWIGSGYNLPLGVSLFALAMKPVHPS